MALTIEGIFLLVSGLILIGSELRSIPKVGEGLKKTADWLGRFGVFIGVINLVLFVLALIR